MQPCSAFRYVSRAFKKTLKEVLTRTNINHFGTPSRLHGNIPITKEVMLRYNLVVNVWLHLSLNAAGLVRTQLLPPQCRSICPSDLINGSIVCRESEVDTEKFTDWNEN